MKVKDAVLSEALISAETTNAPKKNDKLIVTLPSVLTGAYRDSCLVRLFGLSGYFSGFLDPSTWNIWSSNVTTLSLQPQRTNFLRKHGLRGHLPETLLRLNTALV
ncbi:hypothetical protein MRX96_057008 [Rhipicephalus microplus]